MKGDPCFYCDKPHVKLCDYIIGVIVSGPKKPKDGHAIDSLNPVTCDRPLCTDHTTIEGRIMACSRSGKHRGCHHDTIDKCVEHVGMRDNHPPLYTQEEMEVVKKKILTRPLRIIEPTA